MAVGPVPAGITVAQDGSGSLTVRTGALPDLNRQAQKPVVIQRKQVGELESHGRDHTPGCKPRLRDSALGPIV